MLPPGDSAYVTTTDLLPRGEHILADFAYQGDGQLALYAYTRCGTRRCADEEK
jgi:hypothetical protein